MVHIGFKLGTALFHVGFKLGSKWLHVEFRLGSSSLAKWCQSQIGALSGFRCGSSWVQVGFTPDSERAQIGLRLIGLIIPEGDPPYLKQTVAKHEGRVFPARMKDNHKTGDLRA